MVSRNLRNEFIIVISSFLIFLLIGNANATIITVNSEGEADYSSIQSGINAASAGDIIVVQSGIYFEKVVVNKTLSLKGIEKPLVNAGGNGTGITIAANNCTIDGFNVTGSGTDWNGGDADGGIKIKSDNNSVLNNIVSSNNYGIFIFESSDNIIRNNTIYNNEEGIYAFISPLNSFDSNILINNANRGIYISNSYDIVVSNNEITNNYHGIYLGESDNNTLINNTISANYQGIYLDGSAGNTLTNNTVFSNSLDSIFLDVSVFNILTNNTIKNSDNGIRLRYSDNNVLANNTASGNCFNGIYLDFADSNILKNNYALSNRRHGIQVYFSNTNTLTNNTAITNTNNGIDIYHSDGGFLINNNVSNNDYGILISSSSDFFFLKNNLIENVHYNAYSTDGYNTWVQNYYSDYCGTDSNGDGTGDTKYYLPPDGRDKDAFPSMQPLSKIGEGSSFRLITGETMPLYEGYSLECKQVDVDGERAWIEFDKNGTYVDDMIISEGQFINYVKTDGDFSQLICFGILDQRSREQLTVI